MPPGFSVLDFYYLLPELVLTSGALVLLIVNVMVSQKSQSLLMWLALGIVVMTGASMLPLAGVNVTVARGLMAVDTFAFFFQDHLFSGGGSNHFDVVSLS